MTRKHHIISRPAAGRFVILAVLAIHSLTFAKVTEQKQLSSKKLRSMARIFMTYGDYEKACGLAEKAYATALKAEAETNEVALCMIDLGTVYSNLNRLSDAGKMLQEGVTLQKQALFDNHPYVAHTYRLLSDVQRRDGQLETSEATLAKAVNIMLTHCSLESNEMSPFILESAKLYSAKGDFAKAEENYKVALDMIEETYGKQHLLTANVLESMAECCLTQQKYDKADTYISSALAIEGKLFGRYNPVLVDSWLTKARICRANGQVDRSEYYLNKAVASVEKSRNAITLARVFEQVNRIRTEKLYVAAVGLN